MCVCTYLHKHEQHCVYIYIDSYIHSKMFANLSAHMHVYTHWGFGNSRYLLPQALPWSLTPLLAASKVNKAAGMCEVAETMSSQPSMVMIVFTCVILCTDLSSSNPISNSVAILDGAATIYTQLYISHKRYQVLLDYSCERSCPQLLAYCSPVF